MPNNTTAQFEHAHTLAIARQSALIAELIELTFPADTPDKLRVQELAYQLAELRGSMHVAAQDGCDTLLRVIAGLGAVLRLLEADGDTFEATHGLHCLLTPLKQQLDGAVNRVQGLI
ncbi:DUF1484 family protein [Cupriavidus basilensis]|uniref:DUF1484 family protein n=1 Tax=Cupriavidus basilensis TaxID=68895 RepID=A0ABT6ALJ9_9BURK|nr:DUF1484 family protein [Cupriavidus basilensis]MDF3833477.1 DUF1484 family protein [Cupriavidus basilensis]